MKTERYFSVEADGFYGAYFPNERESDRAFLVMLGDNIDDLLAKTGVKWLQKKAATA